MPASLMSIEKEIRLNDTRKRYDIVVYNSSLKPLLLVECKAPDVPLTKATAEQALRYNLILGVKYLLLSNGVSDLVIRVSEGQRAEFLPELPDFRQLL